MDITSSFQSIFHPFFERHGLPGSNFISKQIWHKTEIRSPSYVPSKYAQKSYFSYKTTKCHFQNKPFPTHFKINQNMPISSLFFEINWNVSNSTSSLLDSHIDTLPQFTKLLSRHFNLLHPSGSNSNTLTYHILFLMPILNNTNSNKSSLYTINIVLTINIFQPTIQP